MSLSADTMYHASQRQQLETELRWRPGHGHWTLTRRLGLNNVGAGDVGAGDVGAGGRYKVILTYIPVVGEWTIMNVMLSYTCL
jgi:hypothetical protein